MTSRLISQSENRNFGVMVSRLTFLPMNNYYQDIWMFISLHICLPTDTPTRQLVSYLYYQSWWIQLCAKSKQSWNLSAFINTFLHLTTCLMQVGETLLIQVLGNFQVIKPPSEPSRGIKCGKVHSRSPSFTQKWYILLFLLTSHQPTWVSSPKQESCHVP